MYGRGVKCTKFWLEMLKKTDRLENLDMDGRWNNIKIDCKEIVWKICTGFMWKRIGTTDRLLWAH
jgi:hypothetical protein